MKRIAAFALVSFAIVACTVNEANALLAYALMIIAAYAIWDAFTRSIRDELRPYASERPPPMDEPATRLERAPLKTARKPSTKPCGKVRS